MRRACGPSPELRNARDAAREPPGIASEGRYHWVRRCLLLAAYAPRSTMAAHRVARVPVPRFVGTPVRPARPWVPAPVDCHAGQVHVRLHRCRRCRGQFSHVPASEIGAAARITLAHGCYAFVVAGHCLTLVETAKRFGLRSWRSFGLQRSILPVQAGRTEADTHLRAKEVPSGWRFR